MKRDKNGYLQVRDGIGDPWRFVVTGFDDTSTGQDGFCTVQCANGERERNVPIDANDRILINGRRYGRRNWIH